MCGAVLPPVGSPVTRRVTRNSNEKSLTIKNKGLMHGAEYPGKVFRFRETCVLRVLVGVLVKGARVRRV